MWWLLLACAPAPSGPEAGLLVLLGGPPLDDGVRAFAEAAGGEGATVAFVPTAATTSKLDDLSVADDLEAMGLTLLTMHTRDPVEADDEAFCEPLDEADAIWFAGGEPLRLVRAYADTRFAAEVTGRARAGVPVGGASAGAMFLAEHSLRTDMGGEVLIEESFGLGLLSDTVIDTHWHSKHRVGELAHVVDQQPELAGLGLDDGVTALVRGTSVEVLGEGQVGWLPRPDTLELHSPGTTFELD